MDADEAVTKGAEPRSPTPPPSTSITAQLRVKRVQIVTDMLEHFTYKNIIGVPVRFIFVNERGVDEEGLSRDVYTAFWTDFLNTSSNGEFERVPALCNSMLQEHWNAVGRILVKGFVDHKVFPVQLSFAFVVVLIFGEAAVTNEVFLHSLLSFVGPAEKSMLQNILSAGTIDGDVYDEFVDFLSCMDCRQVPEAADVQSMLVQIAQRHLIQESHYALKCMAAECRQHLQLYIQDVKALQELHAEKRPPT
jgi:hypothetical protein